MFSHRSEVYYARRTICWSRPNSSRNIGILITDHNVQETLTITDRAYLLFEGRILFQGAPEELAENKIVREKYLSNSFVLRKKDFQTLDEERKARENS